MQTPFDEARLRLRNDGVDRYGAGMIECKKEKNLARCTCTYDPCSRKGMCCDCVAYHLKSRELPGCVFSAAAERTYDRSFEHFARLVSANKI